MNGTTNYILSRMAAEGVAYDGVLKEAQKLGYAEADPAADVRPRGQKGPAQYKRFGRPGEGDPAVELPFRAIRHCNAMPKE